jgi:hypothetical protein
MTKGYPISLPLQMKLAAKTTFSHRHIQKDNCGEIAALPDAVHLLLTMNSMAQHVVTD